jgi:alpha/beta superfamily hydrolase
VPPTQITTADGHVLRADLAEPDGPVRGAVVVCHPHPLYGGNRHNMVVDAVFRALPATGFRALRFDFRAEHGSGVAETADVVAALDALDAFAESRADVVPLFVVGYSFGAAVALRTVDPRIRAVVAIAPPLPTMPVDPPSVPVLVLTPRHDQYCPPDVAEPIVATWPDAEIDIVESADHFLTGHTTAVARHAVAWLSSLHS